MDEGIRVLAKTTFNKEKYQEFAEAFYKQDWEYVTELANECYDDAQEQVLDTVYKDECDFVLMGHYRNAKDLLTKISELE